MDFACSFASANVQSLYRGPHGHAGKLHFLQKQMRHFQLNFLAVQEARSEQAMTNHDQILRICTGHSKGNFGVELWVDLQRPFGHVGTGRTPCKFRKEHFVVVHSDPHRLLVHCQAAQLDIWLFCGHAPHGGHVAHDRHDWWQTTQGILAKHVTSQQLLLLLDANAAPGDRDDVAVLSEGFSTSVNTPDFRALLTAWDLYLPATSGVHMGTNATWTGLDGVTEHCIDHIAIPRSWCSACTHSQTLLEFDLATTHDDHRAIAIQLQWKEFIVQQTPHGDGQASLKPCKYVRTSTHDDAIKKISVHSWDADVEIQAGSLSKQLREILEQAQSPAKEGPKKTIY